ncbi:hypothetical protein CC80DRAFT_491952 [Byssothecium circinans]|uniref:Uncharacterized protein n=1 Tax=Byssothecium circinans TaxID=147558 RepID=A0A6A5TXS2_9PLEO|nr:hypothetical protein CC80DRAFT_491952 [Byssothecium circinans]
MTTKKNYNNYSHNNGDTRDTAKRPNPHQRTLNPSIAQYSHFSLSSHPIPHLSLHPQKIPPTLHRVTHPPSEPVHTYTRESSKKERISVLPRLSIHQSRLAPYTDPIFAI